MVKKYIPNTKEKYMCAKHKSFFKARLIEWRNALTNTVLSDLAAKGNTVSE